MKQCFGVFWQPQPMLCVYLCTKALQSRHITAEKHDQSESHLLFPLVKCSFDFVRTFLPKYSYVGYRLARNPTSGVPDSRDTQAASRVPRSTFLSGVSVCGARLRGTTCNVNARRSCFHGKLTAIRSMKTHRKEFQRPSKPITLCVQPGVMVFHNECSSSSSEIGSAPLQKNPR